MFVNSFHPTKAETSLDVSQVTNFMKGRLCLSAFRSSCSFFLRLAAVGMNHVHISVLLMRSYGGFSRCFDLAVLMNVEDVPFIASHVSFQQLGRFSSPPPPPRKSNQSHINKS